MLLLQLLIIYAPFMQTLFGTEALPFRYWVITLVIALRCRAPAFKGLGDIKDSSSTAKRRVVLSSADAYRDAAAGSTCQPPPKAW